MAKATAELFKNRIIGYGTKPADQFTANPLNYRKHPQRQRDAVNASLRELGWISTVVENVTTGNVIDGHERIWQALQRNEDVPYLKVELSEAEERLALAVFDPLTNMAETDAAILDDLLREVNTGEAALQALLAELADGAGLYGDKGTEGDTPAEVDRAEELRQKWGVKSGDLWSLGDHLLVCGDCTDAATVARVMGGERAAAVVTDPPYGVTREPWDRKLTDDDVSAALSICDGAVLMFGAARPDIVRDVLLLSELPNRIMIWRTTTPKAGSGMFWTWQPIYCWRANFNGWDSLDWQDAPTTTGEHPTQKPVGFMQKLIGMVSDSGAIIYEPFSGSGTTIIACENLGRRCRAVEISPAYVAVALERWATHTSKTPVLI